MSKVVISQAEIVDAAELKSTSINAFEENFEKYGHYPPEVEPFRMASRQNSKWHLL
ncbi:hypothetical protein [Endozoicomonas montiporae]|uniref:hypothetical protein n=1 Tax=Endozoicomonas montiporae TaxID=1027273 RepID=UPI000A489644|nr:hypothetical protein [Endozoicomonas montiporae]